MPDCEYLATCPYYNDAAYGMPEYARNQYCRDDYHRCGRYMLSKAREINKPTPNPYPEFLEDEVSGAKVPDERHRIWDKAYEAGQRDLIEWSALSPKKDRIR